MNYTLSYKPEVMTTAEAISAGTIADMSLYFDRKRKGHNGDYVGGMQSVVLSKRGEEPRLITSEEVTLRELEEQLAQGYDLLSLAGTTDPENGDSYIDEAVLVVNDPARAASIKTQLTNPNVIARFKQLALFACLNAK